MEAMMKNFMKNMSKEDKQKMMQEFMNSMTDEERTEMMQLMMPIMMKNMKPSTMMTNMMKNFDDNECRKMMAEMAPEDFQLLQGWIHKFRDAAVGANIIGVFDCQGQVSRLVKTVMRIIRIRKSVHGRELTAVKVNPMRHDWSEQEPSQTR
jgi:ABC-type methionine transport system ATPase subunit